MGGFLCGGVGYLFLDRKAPRTCGAFLLSMASRRSPAGMRDAVRPIDKKKAPRNWGPSAKWTANFHPDKPAPREARRYA
jgi:hypothetical protein